MGHHFVPQRYLRGFQAPTKADWIWMYDKTNDTSKFVPINKVAQSAGFYDEEVEQMLNLQVEIPGNNVIDKIRRNEAIDERDRLCLTYYIGTMIRRVPLARAKAQAFLPRALADVAAETREWIEEAARQGHRRPDDGRPPC